MSHLIHGFCEVYGFALRDLTRMSGSPCDCGLHSAETLEKVHSLQRRILHAVTQFAIKQCENGDLASESEFWILRNALKLRRVWGLPSVDLDNGLIPATLGGAVSGDREIVLLE